MRRKAAFVLCLVLAYCRIAGAQPTADGIGIDRQPFTKRAAWLAQLKVLKEDTSKVNLLLKIGGIYYWNDSKGSLDSAVTIGRSAAALSKSLKYTKGYTDAYNLICNAFTKKRDLESAKALLKDVYGEMYVRLLLVLSEYYINHKDASPEELRKALPYLELANKQSIRQRSRKWMTESSIAQAKYHFRLSEMTAGKNCFYRVIKYYKQTGDKEQQAHWWQELARYIPDSDSTYATEVYSINKAKALFQELGNMEEVATCIWMEGYYHWQHDKPELAEKLYLLELQTLQAAKLDKEVTASCQRLSGLYERQRNYDKAMHYALLGLKNLQTLNDSSQYSSIYLALGNIHRSMGNYPESIRYYKLVYATSPVHRVWTYNLLRLLIDAQIKSGHPDEGLNFLQKFIKERDTPQTSVNRQLLAFAFGNCYSAMKQYAEAENYYLEMIRLNKEVEYAQRSNSGKMEPVAGAEAFLTIGQFYANTGKFEHAARYLKLALASESLTPTFERDTRHMLFKADSAAGNLMAAIQNYQRFKFLSDSIENNTKSKEVSILKANFKAAQKEKDIRLLTKEAALHKEKLELAARTEKYAYAGFAVLLCVLGLLYNSYRIKQSKNRQLMEQQKTISIKNASLIQLVTEKEWLLREVHHRVKNNLQIVISLLNSQSAYLKEEVAVNAIVESRHRIQAMSMLHQRIYQSEDLTSIGMSSYIHELVSYLNSSFNTGKQIIFNIHVEKIELDLSQAVPIGLILNEAITNSLKYAFPGGREGEVRVSFIKATEDDILLSIADDGMGLPSAFDVDAVETFGFRLMKGLAEDLEGSLQVHSECGTTLQVLFPHRILQAASAPDPVATDSIS